MKMDSHRCGPAIVMALIGALLIIGALLELELCTVAPPSRYEIIVVLPLTILP